MGKQFFFEKKNQKTFISSAHVAGENRDSDVKVFCFFCSEKKILLPLILSVRFLASLGCFSDRRPGCLRPRFGCNRISIRLEGLAEPMRLACQGFAPIRWVFCIGLHMRAPGIRRWHVFRQREPGSKSLLSPHMMRRCCPVDIDQAQHQLKRFEAL